MKNEIKKVVLMANNPDAVGGITTFINNLAPGFRDAGYEVELVTVEHMHEDSEYRLDSSFKHRIGVASAMPKNRWFKHLRDYLNPRIYLNKKKYDRLKKQAYTNLANMYAEWGRDTVVIISQVYTAEHLKRGGVNLTTSKGPYVIGMYHGAYEQAVDTHDVGRLRSAFKDVDKFLLLTKQDAADFRKIEGFRNTGYVPNPISIEENAGKHTKENILVSLGRYHRHKSLDYMIRAWSEISRSYPGWRLEMYGDGEEEAKLQKLIDELKITENTMLMGKTSDINGVLSKSSINVLSSQTEGLPIAIVEAARFHIPTVSFNCAPGITELIHDGETGIVVPKNDTHGLAMGMKQLIADEKKRRAMGKLAYEDSKKYRPSNIVSQWKRIFDYLIV